MLNYYDSSHIYTMLEFQRAAVTPAQMAAAFTKTWMESSLNPLAYTEIGKKAVASLELFERMVQRYGKPEFGIESVEMNGKEVAVKEKVISRRKFCHLIHFEKETKNPGPKLLIVAPMSGHFATLLRGTVRDTLPHFDVYITDWMDVRDIPLAEGLFGFDDYVEYVINFMHRIDERVHVMAVCQPSVPVLCAISLMAAENDKLAPKTATLIGGPIDTRKSPTEVNKLAYEKPLSWFERNVISRVPFQYPGAMREVYPGFVQLTGFMTMNLERHIGEHMKLYEHLVEGDGDSVEAHKTFYDEYLSVMDLDAKFYLETVKHVFQDFDLPKGTMKVGGKLVQPEAITKTAILAIEGERDDISGRNQTKAALTLCKGLPDSKKTYHLQKKVGHYGTFNGRRFREEVVPVIVGFAKKHGK